MEWFKMLSRYYFDGAVVKAGEAAEVLFVRSIAYATDHETAGFVPAYQLERFGLKGARRRADALVASGLWTPEPDGWRITSYERIQEEMVKVVLRREADRLRKRRGSSAEVPAEGARNSSLLSGNGSSSGVEKEDPRSSPNPASAGGCAKHRDAPGNNCRACGTTARQLNRAASAKGTWCGACNEERRMFEDEDGMEHRCSCATPNHLRVVRDESA